LIFNVLIADTKIVRQFNSFLQFVKQQVYVEMSDVKDSVVV